MFDTKKKSIKKRTRCRACGGASLSKFLDLGNSPLANSFLSSESEFANEAFFPLAVYFCNECSLVQLTDVVDPDVLFSNYLYVTGTSDTILSHNREYADAVIDLMKLGSRDLVLELASNNGNLLSCFKEKGIRTLGVEPAKNIAEIANRAGIETIVAFFNSTTASQISDIHGKAQAIVANNVLAHVDDPMDFLSGCKSLIDDEGLVVIEVPYLEEFVEFIEFDTVYHEHLCYFSITSLMRLFESVGLSIVRVDRVAVHGGSIRVYAGKIDKYPDHSLDAVAFFRREQELGLNSPETFVSFANKVGVLRERLRALLISLKDQGKTIAGYGAPAKGNTLLNYCSIGSEILDFVVDKNPLKVGLYTPGTHLHVKPVSAVFESQPDYLLILAWNFADEIMEQLVEYRSIGGRFIIPVPEPRIIEV